MDIYADPNTYFAEVSSVNLPESESYKALVYGIIGASESGIPRGKFWDLREFPVPRSNNPTTFKLQVSPTQVNKLHRIDIRREQPTEDANSQTIYIVPEAEVSYFNIQLSPGLNYLETYFEDVRLHVYGVTSTVYALLLSALSGSIYKHLWAPLDQLRVSITGSRSSLMLESLIGNLSFPENENVRLLARQKLITGLASYANYETLTSCFFRQTPLVCRFVAPNKDNSLHEYLMPVLSAAQHNNQKECNIWAINRIESNLASLPVHHYRQNTLVSSRLNVVNTLETSIIIPNDTQSTEDNNETESVYAQDELEYDETFELFVTSTQGYDATLHLDSTVVDYPGLWDNGIVPSLDTGGTWDQGDLLDSADTSGDPVQDGFVGTRINLSEIGSLDRLVETTTILSLDVTELELS